VDILMLALVGLVIYWVIKLISPGTARRVKDMISGERPAAATSSRVRRRYARRERPGSPGRFVLAGTSVPRRNGAGVHVPEMRQPALRPPDHRGASARHLAAPLPCQRTPPATHANSPASCVRRSSIVASRAEHRGQPRTPCDGDARH